MMLCLEDCLDFCELDPTEVEEIAHHEHVPLVVAAEMGCTYLKSEEGVRALESMFLENASNALSHGARDEAARCYAVYQHFHAAHSTHSSG